MSEVIFPAAEYTDETIDLKGRLEEEIRLYPTEAEFQLSLKGLEALHAGTVFFGMVQDVGEAIGATSAYIESNPRKAYSWSKMFVDGGLVGLHLATSDLPDGLSAGIHRLNDPDYDVFEQYENMEVRQQILDLISDLEEIDAQGFDPGDSETVALAAALCDASLDGDEIGRWHFAIGYRFAVDKVRESSECFTDYDSLIKIYEEQEM